MQEHFHFIFIKNFYFIFFSSKILIEMKNILFIINIHREKKLFNIYIIFFIIIKKKKIFYINKEINFFYYY